MAATVIVTVPLIVLTLVLAAADPRRPHRRRRQGLARLDGVSGLRVEEVEAARVHGELDLAALPDPAAGIDAGDEPCASFLRAGRRGAESWIVVGRRTRDEDGR